MLIYLAGVEQKDSDLNIKHKEIKNAFLSYYYLRNTTSIEKLKFRRDNIKNIILDSGAHSFFSEMTEKGLSVSVHKKKSKTKETPYEYWENYKKWLLKYHQYVDYFVELDIGEIVGQETVLKWREELKKLGLYKKCITVYHPDIMSFNDYISMLEDSQSKYVALEGDRPQKRTRLPYLKLIKEAYKRGIKTHGFAMTKVDVVDKYPFYSVDSTSWKAGCQYGASKVLTSKGIEVVRFKNKKNFFRLKGATPQELFGKDKGASRYKIYKLSVLAYSKWEKEITNLWAKRGIKYE